MKNRAVSDLGIYIHIPFCVKKCLYCDFLSFPICAGVADEEMRVYVSALIREMRGYAEAAAGRKVQSIFIGGGTPSLLPPDAFGEIFRALYDLFDIAPDAEITMEMNPGTVDERRLAPAFRYLTRVSVGVQSFDDRELRAIGRIHSAEEADRSFHLLRSCGLHNINLDLMYDLPGQNVSSFRETLLHAKELSPEHLSVYSLIVEEGTPFGDMAASGRLNLPDEETEAAMTDLAEKELSEGYEHYEISNFAKEGFRCRHNVRYWKRGDYLGFGLGASSLFDGRRWSNTRDMAKYLRESSDPRLLRENEERLSEKSAMEEFMFLGLRMTEGVRKEDFRRMFGRELSEVYGRVIAEHIREGLMNRTREGVALTRRGMEVSNVVLADYLMD